ncbi:serine/threonine protein kinase [Xenorhabdus bovienii]|uniref:serine/threonine protein kinase n=1 Tax=Xenorhabdus bovienii TaxID=40576 RepID=UPI0023B2F4F3|nr:serine/threonine-protein kinase [Xenorhabdus bovienii]MDE9453935.1 serine/threonine protein kinase [Xenorhabdus bovienii]
MQNTHNNDSSGEFSLSHALPIGYCFNEFEIEEVIGEGGFSIVYRAWDHRLKRTIAIKEYMPSILVVRRRDLKLNLRRASLKKRFQIGLHNFMHEAHLMTCFNHPCLPRFLRFWQQNSTAYIATPFYSGMTLKKLQTKCPKIINQNWIYNMLFPLLDAIDTLHQAGYLHCDISLDNILIQDDQLPILLDLGSARKATERLSDEKEVTISPGFTAVEQYTVNEEGQQGPWTDIYSLGAVLHTLIVGTPPPASIVRDIEDNYQPLSKLCPAGYSSSFLHVIDRTLKIKLSERPLSITKLVTQIKASTIKTCRVPVLSYTRPNTFTAYVPPVSSNSE